MDEHREELATIETLDSGAVYTLALKTHIGMSIDTVRYFAGWCDKIQVMTKAQWYMYLSTFDLNRTSKYNWPVKKNVSHFRMMIFALLF